MRPNGRNQSSTRTLCACYYSEGRELTATCLRISSPIQSGGGVVNPHKMHESTLQKRAGLVLHCIRIRLCVSAAPHTSMVRPKRWKAKSASPLYLHAPCAINRRTRMTK